MHMKTTNKILLGVFVLILIAIAILMVVVRVQLKAAVFIEPSGQVVSSAVDLPAFNGIEASGNLNLLIRQGDHHEVVVRADDNLMEYILTEVEDEVLKISMRAWAGKNATIEMEVDLVEIGSLVAQGGANVQSQNTLKGNVLRHVVHSGAISRLNIDFDLLQLDLHSGAQVTIGGRVREMTAKNNGGSMLDASALEAETVDLSTNTGSQSDLFVTGSLEVKANTGSLVNYTGNPLHKEISANTGAVVNPR
jgi:hypothetical protein